MTGFGSDLGVEDDLWKYLQGLNMSIGSIAWVLVFRRLKINFGSPLGVNDGLWK